MIKKQIAYKEKVISHFVSKNMSRKKFNLGIFFFKFIFIHCQKKKRK